MEIKFGHIEIFVKEPQASKEFYTEKLGFELVEVQFEKFIWLSSGNITFLLRQGNNLTKSDTYQTAEKGIVLYTDNLESAANVLKSRGVEFKGTDGSDKCLTFTDPDGNWFQLVNPVDH